MISARCIVSVLVFLFIAGVVGQMTTRTLITRKFKYEAACWDPEYGEVVSKYNKILVKEKCQMKCVDAGPSCVAFFWVNNWSHCRLYKEKHVDRTLHCDPWHQEVPKTNYMSKKKIRRWNAFR